MASDLHVLIIGAGTAGLMLGLLLERADISYEIFEKSKELRPLGSGIALSALRALFEQLGMWEELQAISKPFGALHLKNEDLTEVGVFRARGEGVMNVKDVYGEYSSVVARPDLINLLLSRIPPNRLHYNKRVLKTKQDEDHVQITCSDNSAYKGSILVGADGAYSSVRQNMYKELEELGKLPKIDAKPMQYGYDCVVGVTQPLDPKKYPVVDDKFCEFEIILGKDIPFAWWFMPLQGRRIGWMVVQDERKSGDQRNFRYSEWGQEAAQALCKQVAHLPSPYGGTLGDVIEETDKDQITKVMLEEKCFQTWYRGRTVLLGDAAHKMLPFGGQGASCAIQGALELTNLLYDMDSSSQKDITKVFEQYYKSRFETGRTSVNLSNQMGSLMHAKGFLGNLTRRIALNYTPQWIIRKASDKYNAVPPQLRFLPYVKLRGTFKRDHAKPSKKLLAAKATAAAV